MKKSIKTALFIALALICAFGFASCGLFGDSDKNGGDVGGGSESGGNNNGGNNGGGRGTEQVITTAAAWDKVMSDTDAELFQTSANFKYAMLITGKGDFIGYERQQITEVVGNKAKAFRSQTDYDEDDGDYDYCEDHYYYEITEGKAYYYNSYDECESFEKREDDYYDAEEIPTMGEYVRDWGTGIFFRFIGLVGMFDRFTYADGLYAAKEGKGLSLYIAMIQTEIDAVITDIKIKITAGKVSGIFMTFDFYDKDDELKIVISYGGQTVNLPKNYTWVE